MKALFDLSFTNFITPSIARIVYVLIMVLIGLSYLTAVIASFAANKVLGVFVLIILGPLVALVYLVVARVVLESLIASIRTAQNTSDLVRLGGGHPFEPAGATAGYPVSPQYPTAPANPQYPAAPPVPPEA